MLKLLAILALFAALAGTIVFVTCKYENPCQVETRSADNHAGQQVVASDSSPHSENANNDAPQSSNCAPCWYKLLAWPDGIVAWALLATLFVVSWQSWETSRSARATEKQIELQMIQWVDYGAWWCKLRKWNPDKFQVLFNVINQTNFPFRFDDADVIFELDGQEPVHVPFIQHLVLTPRSPQTISVWLSPTHEQFQDFLTNTLQVRVRADLSYIGVRGKRKEMKFEGTLWCRRNNPWFAVDTKSS